jgi:hypothetical protein
VREEDQGSRIIAPHDPIVEQSYQLYHFRQHNGGDPFWRDATAGCFGKPALRASRSLPLQNAGEMRGRRSIGARPGRVSSWSQTLLTGLLHSAGQTGKLWRKWPPLVEPGENTRMRYSPGCAVRRWLGKRKAWFRSAHYPPNWGRPCKSARRADSTMGWICASRAVLPDPGCSQ